MVSLNQNHGRGSGGGMSFDDRSIGVGDEPARENTPLIANVELPYRPIRTTPFIVIHILLVITFEVAIILLPFLCHPSSKCDGQHGYETALYVHAGAYIVNLAFDRFYHYQQDLSRRDGYLDFYRKVRNLRRVPLLIISAGNALLVALIKTLERFCPNEQPCTKFKLHPWYFLQLLTSIEVIMVLVALVWYLALTIKFNSKQARPDATQDDLQSSFVTSQTSANEIGFRDETFRENVLEKQADMIRYLRERNDYLAHLVLQQRQQSDIHRGNPGNNHL